MTAGTVLSRVTGLLRISAQAWAIGVSVSALADTYNTANVAPNIVYELLLGGILTSVFVPVFVDWTKTHGRDEAWAVADRVLTLTLVVLGIAAVIAAIFAPQIMRFYTVARDDADRARQIEVGAFFLRWFMPQMVFYGIGAVASGLLNAGRRFAAPMFAPVLNNLVVICIFVAYGLSRGDEPASLVDLSTTQAMLLAAGTTLGVVAMTVALWPSLRRMGYRWHLRFDWRHPAVNRLVRLSGWVLVYVGANQLAYQLIIVLNGRIGVGALTAYQFAFILFLLPHSIFVVSIVTALIPGMAERWSATDRDGIRALFSRGVRDTAVIILPAALGYVALAVPISRLIFERGQTAQVDADTIAHTLQAFALGLPFFSAFQVLTRSFYATQDSRTPALMNVAAAVTNVAVDVLLVVGLGMGVPGMALGHAASYMLGAIALAWLLRKRLGGLDGARILRTVGRTLPAAALSGLAAAGTAALVQRFGGAGGTGVLVAQVVLGVGVGVLVFAGAGLIFGIEEAGEVRHAIRARFGR
jgi:putative peptidoglycan lipid II flippase